MPAAKKIIITFHLHGPLRKVGNEVSLELSHSISTTEMLAVFFAHYPELASWQKVTRCAMDLEYLPMNFKFENNAEIHLIPPVSGG